MLPVPFVWEIFLIVLGFSFLIVGGDKLVEGASSLARRFNMSEMFIGIAVVGFGTSLPELMATLSAMKAGSPEIALGNIIGSNIANMGLILGVALMMTSKASGLREHKKDYILMLLALAIFTLLAALDLLMTIGGVILIVSLVAYLLVSLKLSVGHDSEEEASHTDLTVVKSVLFIALGFAGLLFGADWLIKGATTLATEIGIPERIIGITLIAVGSSLPELAAAIAAARQKKLSLTAGNILGSNAFNVMAAGGASALSGYLSAEAFKIDFVMMFIFSAILAPLFFLQHRPYKIIGSLLLIGYVMYISVFVI